MKYTISLICLSFSSFATATGSFLSIDAIAKIPNKPKHVQIKTPQELTNITSSDGKRFAIIKTWGYKFNSNAMPNTDLRIINDAILSNQYDYLILESGDSNPVWGWYMARVANRWVLLPVTDKLTNKYQEIFNPEEFN